jgi:hypothetical protein
MDGEMFPLMKHALTFTISLGANLALASMAVCLLKQSFAPRPRASAATLSKPTTAAAADPLSTASYSPDSPTFITNHFTWSQVESEDFEQLALNLRALGCPEKTVRDVVVARAHRSLEQASKERAPHLPFWSAGLRRSRAKRQAEQQAESARQAIVTRLERVIGQDVFLEDAELMDKFEEQALTRFIIGPVPEEAFSNVTATLARFGKLRDQINSRIQGVWLDTDEAELAQLRTEYRRELAAALTSAQLEEMTARMAMLGLMDRVKFEATDLNPAEARQLSLIRARFSDPLNCKDLLFSDKSMTGEQEQELKLAEREFLGEARFAQFERAVDGDFKTLFELGREQNLPLDAAVRVFDLRKLTRQEAERLRQDKSLSDPEREQALAQIQADAQRAVLQVLGADASGKYLGRGGAWITNVSGL